MQRSRAAFASISLLTANIDTQQIKILRERLIDLNTIILLMDRDELIYFDRLRKIANFVLQEVEKTIG